MTVNRRIFLNIIASCGCTLPALATGVLRAAEVDGLSALTSAKLVKYAATR